MGKRPKLKKEFGKLKAFLNRPSDRGYIPTADEAFGMKMSIPDEEAVVLKTVPLKADGVIVGKAHIHDNGTVAMEYFPDADPAALELIRKTAREGGYSLEGVPDGSP